MPGWAIRQSAISMIWCDRWARNPAAPSRLTANLTLVRQPSPGAAGPSLAPSPSPGSASTVTGQSIPAMRRSCWRTTDALSSRCRGSAACCQSQPPHPPGRA